MDKLLLLLAIVATVGCGGASAEPPDVGDIAPGFSLMNVSSQQVVDSSSLKGNVLVLNFWSTDCANCIKEIDELKAIHEDGGAKVVGIAIDQSADLVKTVVDAKDISYPILHGNEDIFVRYDGYSIPYSLVLDSNFTIRKKFYGRVTKDEFDAVFELIGDDGKSSEQ